ncbi:MAG: ATP-binding cassette domain-containing protein [Pseudomonadota bacterium]
MVARFDPGSVTAPAGPLILKGGAPVELPDGAAWQIVQGSVEAYLAWPGGRRLLAVVEEGAHAFPAPTAAEATVLLVAPEGARLEPVTDTSDLVRDAEQWIKQAVSGLPSPAQDGVEVQAGTVDVETGQHFTSKHSVHWLLPGPGLALELSGTGDAVTAPDLAVLAGSLWVTASDPGKVTVRTTAELGPGQLLPAISAVIASLTSVHEAHALASDHAAMARLNRDPDAAEGSDGASVAAVRQIAQAIGLKVEDLPVITAESSALPLPALCRVAGLRARQVTLEAGWHARDQGPLVVRRAANDNAYDALIWDGRGYRVPGRARLSAKAAEDYAHTAHAVSAPLPARVTGIWSLAFHIMRQGNRRDSIVVAMAAAVGAVLGILVPLATAWLLSDIVPAGMAGLLMAVGIALACSALISAVLDSASGIASARIEGRGATALGAALTDRLLRLPTRFFKDYAAGDLNQRLENVEAMRQLAVGILMSAVLTALLSVVYLAVLFSYDTGLALIGIVLVAGYIIAVIVARILQMEAIREAAKLDGEIASLTYETLDGVGKLRATAAEERALDRWLDVYRRERAAAVRGGRVGVNFGAFADAYQTMTLMFLFAGAGALAAVDAPAGVFIGFLAAFGSFQGAFVGLSQAMLQVYSAQPLVERAKPILEAETEIDPGRGDPGRLAGDIEGSGLVFSYATGLPPVLNGLDFHVRPGQHMAIVGGSGSGKSTLLRLLLGFEAPQRGAILYDGQDLTRLDLTRVRSQIGVVLQASQLFAGSILENIRGAGNASLADCLEAAEKAGLARDLEYFAMGVHTPITEGAGSLSGGQRQRILIARALAAKPNILFFDEATSALDNATQAVVSKTLDALAVTRVTIAHRLSTVRNADRICVLQDGRFVELGTYDALMAKNGAFAELARRQLTED